MIAAKRIGRPPGSGLPADMKTKPRSIRLTDARWETLRQLGVSGWLEPLLDRERKRLER